MITKEKLPKEHLDEMQENNQKIDIEELNIKYKSKWKKLILCLVFIFVILTLMVIYILKSYNMRIYNPFETKIIQVTSESKGWYKNDNINLFKNLNEKGEKIIFPGQSGEYEFVIQNNNDVPINYSIKFYEKNIDNINIKYKLKINNVYVIGNENTYETIDKLELQDIKILDKTKSLYTIEWKWEEADNDEELVKNGLATYSVYIDIYSKSIGMQI